MSVRKDPRQQRSRQMVETILQAAAEIFSQLGYARATTNKIAERAGVSIGSLYQYFPNKDSLLAKLLAQHRGEIHAHVGPAFAFLADPATPLEDGLRHVLSELWVVHKSKPALTKALSVTILRQSPVADKFLKEVGNEVLAIRLIALLAARPDVREGDYVAMAAVLGQTMTQSIRWLVHDAPAGVDQAALFDEIIQLLLRYLKK